MSEVESERLGAIKFDVKSVGKRNAEIEHERAVAVSDLLVQNHFAPVGHAAGPYTLTLGLIDNRLMLDIRGHTGAPVVILGLSLSPFRQVLRDYSIMCESYYAAMHAQSLTQVEAVDMGRRAVHNEGAELLIQRLHGKVDIDRDTARRLFTLIHVLRASGAVGAAPAQLPRVLFVCTRNAVRSPMAEALLAARRGSGVRVASAGLVGDPADPLAISVMSEIGLDLNRHEGRALADRRLGDFDQVIALSAAAADALASMLDGVPVERWEVEDATMMEGNREAQLHAYRRVRDALAQRIDARFSAEAGKMP
jgi:uncharacterized protein (UPF0262 family)/protein-tyrosine-phosphatase